MYFSLLILRAALWLTFIAWRPTSLASSLYHGLLTHNLDPSHGPLNLVYFYDYLTTSSVVPWSTYLFLYYEPLNSVTHSLPHKSTTLCTKTYLTPIFLLVPWSTYPRSWPLCRVFSRRAPGRWRTWVFRRPPDPARPRMPSHSMRLSPRM